MLLDMETVAGPSRRAPDVRERQKVMLNLFMKGWRMKDIGAALNRHHTTVADGIRREIKRLMIYERRTRMSA